ncbi:MAG TPA: SDR family oxidoreductase, partial [Myxococcota bacterium]|nr:SDR family oxidoreductase [Myxococcota bacterium]
DAAVGGGWTVELMRETGAVLGVDGDLRDDELPIRLAEAASSLGGLDLLVLNAAVLGPMGPLESIDLEVFGEVMRVNVDRQLAIFQALLPELMKATPSAVIWLSSALGRIGVPGYGAYCASKHAVEGLSKLAHAEYGSRGLISVTVAPGMVQTEMLKAALGVDDVSQHTPPGQVGEAFARLFSVLSAEHSGAALEISDF